MLHGCRKAGVLNFSLRLPVRREASGLRLALAPFSRFQKRAVLFGAEGFSGLDTLGSGTTRRSGSPQRMNVSFARR